MIEKALEIYRKHAEGIKYLFFGGLTFIVGMVTYWIPIQVFDMSVLVANVISWICAVSFAYVTNMLWVFEEKPRTFVAFLRQIFMFAAARLATLGVEELILYVFVERMGMGKFVIKLIAQVIVILLNYVLSKWIIFKKQKDAK